MCSLPLSRMRKRRFTVVVLVALNVSLVLEVQAVLVGEVVEVGVVAVVREADMIDVAALHQHHLLLHLLPRDGMARRGIRLVAVHAFQFHGLSVDIEVATCQAELIVACFCIANLNGADAEVGGGAVKELARLVLEFSHKDIAVGCLGTPKERLPDIDKGLSQRVSFLLDGHDVGRDATHRVACRIGIKFDGIHAVGHR